MKELYFTKRELTRRYEEIGAMAWELIDEESINLKKWMAERLIDQKFADSLGAQGYERTDKCKGNRVGYYFRDLQLKTCRLKNIFLDQQE